MNRSQGRVKTKNPMSRWNSASVVPNGTRLSQSRKVCHWLAPADAAVRLVDLDAQGLKDLAARYGTIVQSIRMISSDGRNVWT